MTHYYTAVFQMPLRNTFVRIDVENSKDSEDQVAADCEALGEKLGLDFLFIEERKVPRPQKKPTPPSSGPAWMAPRLGT